MRLAKCRPTNPQIFTNAYHKRRLYRVYLQMSKYPGAKSIRRPIGTRYQEIGTLIIYVGLILSIFKREGASKQDIFVLLQRLIRNQRMHV